MFVRPFTMRRLCPDCALPFESAAGEITGGLCINATLTLCVLVFLAFLGGNAPAVPLIPLFGGLLLVAVLFPIACYPASRGLWASVLYLTGANAEGDDAGTAVHPAGAMSHEAAQALIRQVKHGRRCMIACCSADMDVTAYLSWRPHCDWVQQTARTPRMAGHPPVGNGGRCRNWRWSAGCGRRVCRSRCAKRRHDRCGCTAAPATGRSGRHGVVPPSCYP